MKKIVYIVSSLLLVTIIILVIVLNNNRMIRVENHQIHFFYEATIQALNEIEIGLNDLKNNEAIIPQLSGNKEFSGFILEDQKANILLSIKDIEEYLEYNKNKLNMLEQQIADSKFQMDGLKQMIEGLRKTIAENEQTITNLRNEISNLSSTLATERRVSAEKISERDATIVKQTVTISQQAEEIERKIVEEYTVYYYMGKKNELIQNGFMSKSGIFQGSKATNVYNTEIMIKISLQEQTEIFISAEKKNVKVLSSQDATSYSLVAYQNETILQITNPELFSKVKYLIIQY